MSQTDYSDRGRIATELEATAEHARQLAEKLGLDGYRVKYWIVGYDDMNRLIAYEGFPTRYPHWRWGMQYDRQRKQDRYGAGKAFEIVVNDDPSHAYLQESNSDADQKAVITHVEAHSDFFKNNRWFTLFDDEVDAVRMLERHADRIEATLDDPEIDREAVEQFIDNVLPLTDAINQQSAFEPAVVAESEDDDTEEPIDLEQFGLSEEVKDAVFGPEFGGTETDAEEEEPVEDVLAFLQKHGRQYDADAEKAVEMEPWQRDVIEILRREAYYFASQRLTKVMNEGFAAYYESLMMGEEAFADVEEFLQYADHQSRVLGSEGLNPYKLGKELWEYIENTANRREVIERLLRVEGITWSNFQDAVDLDRVLDLLEPTPPLGAITADRLDELASLDPSKIDQDALAKARDGEIDVEQYPWKLLTYDGLAERHFSLTKPRHREVLTRLSRQDLERIDRYLLDGDRYDSVEEAIDAVEYTAGWDRILEVRESHNDVTFLDEFLTEEFVRENEYFTYEFSHLTGDFRVASIDPDAVKRKLLLQFTNFGKPTIVVDDGNYRNRNELLLSHQYNGVQLDIDQAIRTLERVFELWGRPVNLRTIVAEPQENSVDDGEPERTEQGKLLRYDGNDAELRDLSWDAVEDIAASDVDYDTTPDDWL